MVDIAKVEAFVAVATYGSFAKAATSLFLTQPSVSARVQGLERELGQRLLERTGRGARLTRAGAVFLPIADRLLRTAAEGRQALEAALSSDGGLVTIAAALSVSTYLLPDIVKSFRDEHPAARVSIRSGHSRDVLRMVLDDEAEIGLARGLTHPAVHTVHLGRDEIILVASPSHPFTQTREARLVDVAGAPLILFDRGSSDWVLITGFFRRGGLLPNAVLELEGIEAAKKMVEKGIGIAMLPRLAIRQELSEGRLVHIRIPDAPALGRYVDLVYRRNRLLSEIAQAFCGHVQGTFPAQGSLEHGRARAARRRQPRRG